MDTHFRLLGVPRGCDEETVRKAYRQRALEYHPDRNPNGAEMFKRIRVSYEAITQHLKAYGGRDVVIPTRSAHPDGSSGSAFKYARHQQQRAGSGSSSSAPLFTDEELFGGGNEVPGGFASEAGRGVGKGAGGGGGGGGADASRPRASPSYAHTAAHTEADSHWRRAHGARVPVSAYEGHAPPGAYPSDRKGEGGPRGARPSASRPSAPSTTSDEEASFKDLYKAYLAKGDRGSGATASTDTLDCDEDEVTQEKMRAVWRNLDHLLSAEEKRAALKASWDALQRDIGRKLQSQEERQQHQQHQQRQQHQQHQQRQSQGASTQAASYNAVEREMAAQAEAARREWHTKRDKLARQEEEERELARKRAAEAILRRHEEEQQRRAALEEAARAERMAVSEKHMDDINDERRALTTQLFYHKYTPEPADVGDMTDVQVYILSDVLRKAQSRVEKVLEARLLRGPCSRCQVHPKNRQTRVFTCTHSCVCEVCATAAQKCPLCGATRASSSATAAAPTNEEDAPAARRTRPRASEPGTPRSAKAEEMNAQKEKEEDESGQDEKATVPDSSN